MFSNSYEINVNGDFSLKQTIESGQTFLWNRQSGKLFDNAENPSYVTCRKKDDELVGIEVYQEKNTVKVNSNSTEAPKLVTRSLGLNQDIDKIQKHILDHDTPNGVMNKAIGTYPGLRIVHEPFFPTLISFICSTQMRVERIHEMVNSLKKSYGSSLETSDGSIYAFPDPDQLIEASESDLKDLNLGYRADYVQSTVQTYVDEGVNLSGDPTEDRKELQKFKGVGTKVADCVLLYGTGLFSVVPVDTWIESAVKEYYPNLYTDSNEEIARNFESIFGKYAGYAQGYLFHYARTED